MRRSRSRSRSRGRRHSRSRSGSSDSVEDGYRIHVGDLGIDCSRKEIERTFEKFGPLIEVWLARNPPCFAFVVYRHKEDAEEAISEMNGKTVCGNRIRTSMALPRTRGRRQRSFDPNLRCYSCGERGHFSRDCNEVWRNRRWGYSRRSLSRSRSRSKSPDRGGRRRKSRSGSRGHRSRSRERRRSRSRDKRRKSRSRSRDRRRSRSKSPREKRKSRSRSRDQRSRSASKEKRSRSRSKDRQRKESVRTETSCMEERSGNDDRSLSDHRTNGDHSEQSVGLVPDYSEEQN